jgi:hypothetical protein
MTKLGVRNVAELVSYPFSDGAREAKLEGVVTCAAGLTKAL